jgi:hypothetical protein
MYYIYYSKKLYNIPVPSFTLTRIPVIKMCVHDMFRRHGTSDAFQVHNELTQGMSLPSVFQHFLQLVTRSSKQSGRFEKSHGVYYYCYHNTQIHTHMQARTPPHTQTSCWLVAWLFMYFLQDCRRWYID